MPERRKKEDVDSLRRGAFALRVAPSSDYDAVNATSQNRQAATGERSSVGGSVGRPLKLATVGPSEEQPDSIPTQSSNKSKFKLKHGHTITFIGLWLFTVVLYLRPAEFYPSPVTASIALIIALGTLAFYIPSQLSSDGTLTTRPPEVNLVLLFMIAGLLSVPLAINPRVAWSEFSGTFIRCIVMFIVIVNVLRTRARLNGLLFLAIVSAVWLSVDAINDFRLGLANVEGYRASGTGTGIFGNTNDMALHVVTILPIGIALVFGSRNIFGKLVFVACSLVMLAAVVLSYSRGAFLGLIVILIFMALKLGPRHRFGVVLCVVLLGAAVLLFLPDNYGGRLLSILMPSLDTGGSADARRGELFRSLYVSLRHPLLGIGMANYQSEMSYRGQVTHNAYTQVACEMGVAALICYTMFIVKPLRKLGQIARETFATRQSSKYFYLSVGLQASLLGYMVSSFFLSVAYLWYIYYLVGFAICLRRLYEAETGVPVVVESRKELKQKKTQQKSLRTSEALST
jgi:putative inorganic carbon (hco3(-)) transporter